MRNHFGVTQRHIGTRAVYNYIASRKHHNGVKNNRQVLKTKQFSPRNSRHTMIKNTKWLNRNWGKMPIGVHTKTVIINI